MKRILAIAFVAVIWVCPVHDAESNYYDRVRSLTNWSDVATYVRALSEDEVWLLANQVRDKQGNWQAYPSAVLLALYYGENWEHKTPTLAKVSRIIQDKCLNPGLRGALAASGFEIGRAWKIEDRLQYFDLVAPLLGERDIAAADKTRIAEYSYRAFTRCLSEVRALSDTNAVKAFVLNACHACARGMMKALA